MSNQDDSYQVLFSSADYLHLQQQCHQLEKLKVQLEQKSKAQLTDNRNLSTKVFDLKEMIDSLTSKQKTLSEQNFSIRAKLFDTEQLLNLRTNEISDLNNKLIKEKELASEYQNHIQMLKNQRELQNQRYKDLELDLQKRVQDAQKREVTLNKQHKEQKHALVNKLEYQIVRLSKIITQKQSQIQSKDKQSKQLRQKYQQMLVKLDQQLTKTLKDKESMLLQIQNLKNINYDLSSKLQIVRNQNYSNQQQWKVVLSNKEKALAEGQTLMLTLKAETCELKDQIIRFQQELIQTHAQKERLIEVLNDIKTKSAQKQMDLIQKYSEQAKIFEQKLVFQTSTIQKLTSQLYQMQQTKKQSSNKMKNKLTEIEKELERQKKYQQQMQKEYDNIIFQMNEQKKQKKGKNEKDQLKQVKQLLKTYFSSMTAGLFEIGNLDQTEIKTILAQQRDIVKQFVVDAVQPFIDNNHRK